jgi:hypothetical protein
MTPFFISTFILSKPSFLHFWHSQHRGIVCQSASYAYLPEPWLIVGQKPMSVVEQSQVLPVLGPASRLVNMLVAGYRAQLNVKLSLTDIRIQSYLSCFLHEEAHVSCHGFRQVYMYDTDIQVIQFPDDRNIGGP